LIIGKIVKIVATRCPILKPNSISAEELTALTRSPKMDLRRPASKGREGRKDGREGQGRGDKGGKGTYF